MTGDHKKVALAARQKIIKRGMDLLLGITLSVLLLPLLVVIGLCIKVSTPGPILYRQRRVGCDGKEFNIYKFRTMHVPAETEQIFPQAVRDDARVTGVGRFLRKTLLDELPQLLNVLRGEMSLVGPRPMTPFFYEKFRDMYAGLEDVKPGITGWAQICSWRGETEELSKVEINVLHDRYYIENWSVLFDLKIIWLTGANGFVMRNAY